MMAFMVQTTKLSCVFLSVIGIAWNYRTKQLINHLRANVFLPYFQLMPDLIAILPNIAHGS